MRTAPRTVFVFLDGVGVGRADADNPVHTLRIFDGIVGRSLVEGVDIRTSRLVAKGIDPLLGVPGIPQSATGQAAIFSGINAAELLGYHLPAYPSPPLQELLASTNLFLEFGKRGRTATFANTYRPEYFCLVDSGAVQHSVTTISCLAAGVPLRGIDGFGQDESVYWDITGEHAKSMAHPPPELTAEQAAGRIGALSNRFDLVVFESFLTDILGHARDRDRIAVFGGILSRFLTSLVSSVPPDTTVVISSDHGNFEDLTTGAHTRNPAILVACGPEAGRFADAKSILDLTPTILAGLDT